MEIIETSVFSKIVDNVLSLEEYRLLQLAVAVNPEVGKIIPASGGLRKIRWGLPGKGKRSGIRVVYYWYKSEEQIVMLYAYKKTKQEVLDGDQIKILRSIIEGSKI